MDYKNLDFQIGGIVPITCIDFPGEVACVVFTQGCCLRCKYCHNPHLIPPKKVGEYSVDYLFKFLDERKNFIDGVVFSGGEPFMQKDIYTVMKYTKSIGLKVGCHTSGIYEKKLEECIKFIDWIGLDIKAMQPDYDKITQVKFSGENAYNSLQFILSSGITYEVRTTVYPYFFTPEKVILLAEHLAKLGVKNYFLQEYRPILKNERKINIYSIVDKTTEEYLKTKFEKFGIRK